jgi:predicted CxxxxCH...CXXCH cytochrome family protein
MPAAYDPATGTCSAVYCHGAVLGDAAATSTSPRWNGGPDQAACGTCHGKPPANHAQRDCVVCHPMTVAASGALSASHVNGIVEIGDGSGPCTGCHGSGTSAAPPRGLHGELYTTALAVGAHRAHLEAPHGLRGPMACGECHIVPTLVEAPGHIDSDLPAEVFPVGAGTVARADGASPAWNRTTATCTGSYCHGGGSHLAADPSPGIRSPLWTAGSSQVYCGSCHGLPPSDTFHAPTLTLSDCTTCHRSVDANGNIVMTGQTSEHLDGITTFR